MMIMMKMMIYSNSDTTSACDRGLLAACGVEMMVMMLMLMLMVKFLHCVFIYILSASVGCSLV